MAYDQIGDAYSDGYGGEQLRAGASHGERAAHELGQDDRRNKRPYSSAGAEKAAHKAERQRKADIAADRKSSSPAAKTPEGSTAHTDDAGGSRASGSGEGGGTPPESRRPLLTDRFSTWGDGGGLLMAFFLYPIGVAALTRGPGGATAWLKAKFFNKVAAAPTKPATPTPAVPAKPSAPTTGSPNTGLVTI